MHFFSFLIGIKQKRIYLGFWFIAQTCNGVISNEYAYHNPYMKEILQWFSTKFDINLENV